MKITVIIPVYNAEKTIQKTLLSLEQQNCDNFNTIIIDDGSTDNSLSIINTFLVQKRRVPYTVISIDNHGVGYARNVGIENAEGDYLLFLDSDDMLSKDVIRLYIECLKRGNIPISTYTSRIDDLVSTNNKTRVLSLSDVIYIFAHKREKVGFFNFVYKKNIVQKYSIKFNTDLQYGEDSLFLWEYLYYLNRSINCKFELIETPLYYYYINPFSAMHKGTKRQTDAIKAIKLATKVYSGTKYWKLFKDYLYPRTVLSVINSYARTESPRLYKWAIQKFFTKDVMKMLMKNGVEAKIKTSAILVEIVPELNYKVLSCLAKEQGR